jgi:hypothetical protein
LLPFLLLGFIGRAPALAAEPVLQACEDEEGYPPFTFLGRDGKAHGYSVDLIEAALSGTGIRLEVTFLPTRRCTAAIDDGSMNAWTEEFWHADYARRWLASDSIYEGTYVLYYARARFPGGLSAAEVLARPDAFPGCGLLGETYDGFPEQQMQVRPHRYSDTFNALFGGRCAFFPELLEFGGAFRLGTTRVIDDPRVGWAVYHLPKRPELPQAYPPGDKEPLYVYIDRRFPRSQDLIRRIDDTVALWRRTGREAEEMARYGPPPVPGR